MDAPPEFEDIEPFIKAAQCLLEIGLNVPEIIAVDRNQGFVLLTDLGTMTYLDYLNENNVDRLYGDALGKSGTVHPEAKALAGVW